MLLFVVTGCNRADATPHDGDDDNRVGVEGSRLVLAASDPKVAMLASTAAVKAAQDSFRLSGRLVWNEDVTVRVFSPLGGRVVRVFANVGQRVRTGDTLALIASPDFGQAQADERRARTDFAIAERTAARTLDLFQHGVAAQKDVQAADADVARARTEQDRASARLSMYGADSSTVGAEFPLRAPLSGIVVDRTITPGQEVRPDQMLASAPQLFAPLFVVTDPTRLWAVLDLAERDLPSVREGSPVELRASAWPDRTFAGRIVSIGGAVDPVSRTVKVRCSVANNDGVLKAEMLASARLQSSTTTSGVAVPATAVLLNGEEHVVFVDEGHGRLRRSAVRVGIPRDGMVPVLSGIAEGEHVVTNDVILFEQLFQHSRSRS